MENGQSDTEKLTPVFITSDDEKSPPPPTPPEDPFPTLDLENSVQVAAGGNSEELGEILRGARTVILLRKAEEAISKAETPEQRLKVARYYQRQLGFVGDLAAGEDVVKKAVDKNAENVPLVNGRKPINYRYAGRTHPSGVKFNALGFPDFTPYAEASFTSNKLTGKYNVDAAMANKHHGLSSTPKGFVWHHVEDGRTMQLISKKIHNAARHTGWVGDNPRQKA